MNISIKKESFVDDRGNAIYILSKSGETFLLNDNVSMCIFRFLTDKSNVDTKRIIDKVREVFSLDHDYKIENDIEDFINQMIEQDIVEENFESSDVINGY
ncbi:PqqD family protein [Neobacillus notoginsengisoli]|uniref:PqqD family protein n=1 Tax=Neobacillus notoginsengisoli TaxID=1578198 RepID=A0A417YQL0_9BACI|nr:PqqD family protein [Neobacillus notoginsengisoli]RHW36031.1 PqqD family protein [Neobacillus notoginsengisoli]